MIGGQQYVQKEGIARTQNRILHGYACVHGSAIHPCYDAAEDLSGSGEGVDQASHTGASFGREVLL